MEQSGISHAPVSPRWASMRRQAFRPPITIVRPWDEEQGWAGACAVPLIIETLGDRVAACHEPGTVRVAIEGQHLRLRVEMRAQTPHTAPDAEPGTGAFWQQDLLEFRLLLSDDGDLFHIGLAASGMAWDNRGLLSEPDKLTATPVDVEGGWGMEMRLDLGAVGLAPPASGGMLDLYALVAPGITLDGVRPLAAQSPAEQAFAQFERFGIFRIVPDARINGPVLLESVEPACPQLRHGDNAVTLVLRNTGDSAVDGRIHLEHECGSGDTYNRTTQVAIGPGQFKRAASTVTLQRRAYTRVNVYFQAGPQRHPLGSVTLRGMPGADEPPVDAHALIHPYLLAAPERIARIRHQRETYGATSAREGKTKPTKEKPEQPLIPRLAGALRTAFGAWLDDDDLSGLDRVAELAGEIAREGIRIAGGQDDPDGFGHHLKIGMSLGGYALAYDAMVPHVDEATAKVLREIGCDLLQLYIDNARDRAWWCTTNANANTVFNANAGMLALALLDEHPRAGEALQLARRWLWRHLDYCQGPDGGNTEGVQYWEYGTMYLLQFGTLLEAVTGSDDGILSHPSIRNISNMIRLGLCPDGAMHGLNDTVPVPLGNQMAYFAASRFGDELAFWYADHAIRWWPKRIEEGHHVPSLASAPWAELYRPDRPALETAPPFPTAFMLQSIQYATLRSAPRYDCLWAAGYKGHRAPFTHHNQPDAGAVFVHLRGERLLIDPGYNKGKPTEHCLPIVDGQGPTAHAEFKGRIEECADHGPYRVLSGDTTQAYGEAARRVRRVVLMWDGGPVAWLDDIVPTGAGKVRAQYQCGGAPRIAEGAPRWTISGAKALMQVDLLGASPETIERHEQAELTKWGYCFADCQMHPVTADYTAAADAPLVTVCRDATDGPLDPPTLERLDDSLLLRLGDGHYARFCRRDGCWIVAEAGVCSEG